MKRRTAILGLGGLVASGGAAMGTGAFTSVEASRDVGVDIRDDTDSYLALRPVDEDGEPVDEGEGRSAGLAQEEPFSLINETTGRLELNITALNADAVTEIPNLFQVRNQGVKGKDVTVFFEQEGPRGDVLEFFTHDDDGDRVILDESEGFELSEGDSFVANVEADTDGVEPGDEIIDTLIINATRRENQ